MSTGGKGSDRRPGAMPDWRWQPAFGSKQQELCLRCGRAGHMVEDCKWPVVQEQRKTAGGAGAMERKSYGKG